MQKLDVTKVESTETQTNISWHRYNDDNADNDSAGMWTVDGILNPDEVLAYAKTMIEEGQDIEVAMNLQ